MRVVATKRDPNARYEADVVPDAIYPSEDLPRLLAESDHVCIALPYTAETHHLFDANMIAQMKPTAYLYNIGRGKIVDENALIEALSAGKIAGAGLDVFETEPLPTDSPLWKMENVILTPHTSGGTPNYFPASPPSSQTTCAAISTINHSRTSTTRREVTDTVVRRKSVIGTVSGR